MRTFTDLTGRRFGRLTVIRQGGYIEQKSGARRFVWECKCDCGNTKLVVTSQLTSGKTKSCGCLRIENGVLLGKAGVKDLTGHRFGRLTVIAPLTEKLSYSTSQIWQCKCDCGAVTIGSQNDLSAGRKVSCGCVNKEHFTRDEEYSFFYKNTHVPLIKNAKLFTSNTSGIRGVSFHKKSNKWRARITFRHRHYELGLFNTKDDAANVRRQAEEMLFEPFIKWYEELKNNKGDTKL